MACGSATPSNTPTARPTPALSQLEQARQQIKHVVIIMQENRSFDHYFGTFPGADGIPMQDGKPTVCNYDPRYKHTCVSLHYDTNDRNSGGPHHPGDSDVDVDGGMMDGFFAKALMAKSGCGDPNNPSCTGASHNDAYDVMGYHDDKQIPNYWRYAQEFVLQDRMFPPAKSWSLPVHLFLVSGWSARCKSGVPMSCVNDIDAPRLPADGLPYAWTDLTYLLHERSVSWGYYLVNGPQPDCFDNPAECGQQTPGVPSIWNPLPGFTTVNDDGQVANVQTLDEFFTAVRNNQLPSVSWIAPDQGSSEHPTALISDGQAHVTGIINAIMQSSSWPQTAIFVSWDDWGGFYDHVVPPTYSANGYGVRVPGLMISPFAKRGLIDHQTLSFDAYNKLIEDLFLDGQRLDPATMSRPDSRPFVGESLASLGDLLQEFDFTQPARAPLVLSPRP
jgi:phospholipase C